MIGYYLSSNNEMCYSSKTQNFSPTKHTRRGKREGVGCKSALTQNQISLSDRQVGYILMVGS